LEDTDAVEDYEIQNQAEDPMAFAASKSDPNMMHCNEAVKAEDSPEFKAAMLKEVDAHTDKEHWEVWAKADAPAGQDVLPSVWSFKCKRRIDAREILNCWETCSPVVNCFLIRLCLIMSLAHVQVGDSAD
jgi:hypothetical protein